MKVRSEPDRDADARASIGIIVPRRIRGVVMLTDVHAPPTDDAVVGAIVIAVIIVVVPVASGFGGGDASAGEGRDNGGNDEQFFHGNYRIFKGAGEVSHRPAEAVLFPGLCDVAAPLFLYHSFQAC